MNYHCLRPCDNFTACQYTVLIPWSFVVRQIVVLVVLPGNGGWSEVSVCHPLCPLCCGRHLCKFSAGNTEREASRNSSGRCSFRERPKVLESPAEKEKRIWERPHKIGCPEFCFWSSQLNTKWIYFYKLISWSSPSFKVVDTRVIT